MEERLRGILGEVGGLATPVEALGIDDDLFAAGLTSYATVGVMLGIEDAFDLEFPDRLLKRETFRSIAALEDAIVGLQATPGAA